MNDHIESIVINELKFLLEMRHEGIVSWDGGVVYPREEARKYIKGLRNYRNNKTTMD